MVDETPAYPVNEIPPPGMRQVRSKVEPGSPFELGAWVLACLAVLVYEVVPRGWSWLLLLTALVVVVGLLKVAMEWRMLLLERRLLERGIAVKARVTHIEHRPEPRRLEHHRFITLNLEGRIPVSLPSLLLGETHITHYQCQDWGGHLIVGSVDDRDEFEEGRTMTVLYDQRNPDNHIVLRKSRYEILKQPLAMEPPDVARGAGR